MIETFPKGSDRDFFCTGDGVKTKCAEAAPAGCLHQEAGTTFPPHREAGTTFPLQAGRASQRSCCGDGRGS